jgi:hypothetical protein
MKNFFLYLFLFFSSFFFSKFVFSQENLDVQLIQTLKVKSFPNVIFKIHVNGLQIGDNVFVFDEDFGKWIVRPISNKFVGYYNELNQKWIRYDVKSQRSIILNGSASYDFDFDTTSSDSIYAFLIEDEKIVQSRLKPVEFDPFDKNISNLLNIRFLPPQKIRNEPGPERVYREWTMGQMEIFLKKEPSTNVPRITFMSSIVTANKRERNGLVRKTFFSYQNVSSSVGNLEEGSIRVLRLRQDPVTSLKPSLKVIDLSDQKLYFTNGAENPVQLQNRNINSVEAAKRLQNLIK